MNEEFHRRQVEADQKLEQQQATHKTHATMETYQLDQHEAQHGHIPSPHPGLSVEPQQPSLWQRIKKMLGM